MDRKNLLIVFSSIFFLGIVVFFGLDYITTYQHEMVHHQIDTYFGCDNVTIDMSFWGTSTTTCNDKNRSITQQEWSLHAYNEVVSYNNAQLVLVIFFCTLMLMVFIFVLYAYAFKDI